MIKASNFAHVNHRFSRFSTLLEFKILWRYTSQGNYKVRTLELFTIYQSLIWRDFKKSIKNRGLILSMQTLHNILLGGMGVNLLDNFVKIFTQLKLHLPGLMKRNLQALWAYNFAIIWGFYRIFYAKWWFNTSKDLCQRLYRDKSHKLSSKKAISLHLSYQVTVLS